MLSEQSRKVSSVHFGCITVSGYNTIRSRLCIHGLHVLIGQHDVLRHLIIRKLPEITAHFQILLQILVYRKNSEFFLFFVPDTYTVQTGNLSISPAFINRSLYLRIQNSSPSEYGRVHIRIKNSLSPCPGIGSHDGGR